jgi:hypothetical protein
VRLLRWTATAAVAATAAAAAAAGEMHELMAQLDQDVGQTRFLLGDR